jgi:biotin carboxylase
MPPDEARVLVVGTTPDYIDHLAGACPDRALFLTDTALRRGARVAPPAEDAEILCDLRDEAAAERAVAAHLGRTHLRLSGIACFDCESMELAASLARRYHLPYPSLEAVRLCRDKLRSKELWRRSGVACPRVRRIRDVSDAAALLADCGGAIVLKPVCGSGSELVFRCEDLPSAAEALQAIRAGLQSRADSRMYRLARQTGVVAIAEQYVSGTEYSCDALVDAGIVQLIRIARKYRSDEPWLGTTRAYELPASPARISPAALADSLGRAATSLGLDRAMCMADFVEQDGRAVFLEIAPRPGGDCLPPLIARSCGLDMLAAHLDHAECRPLEIPPPDRWQRLVGLRLHADREGTIHAVRTDALPRDGRVREVTILRAAGDHVRLPPHDYDSWLLGHVIFRPDPGNVEAQCSRIAAAVQVDWAQRREPN